MNNAIMIKQLGNKVLREECKIVNDINTDETQSIIKHLKSTFEELNSIGMAANQIGFTERILIFQSRKGLAFPQAPKIPPLLLINPIIVESSEEQILDWDGCLSIPGLRGLVKRAKWIKIEYQNLQGDIINSKYDGLPARVVQHEIDHLDGILFIDRLSSTKDLISEYEFQKLIRARNKD